MLAARLPLKHSIRRVCAATPHQPCTQPPHDPIRYSSGARRARIAVMNAIDRVKGG
ncbi:hypothetical protein IG631_20606 [Alternaria alternata]|nr:hypothetical protein IG631_20606 [Alternaria alternata]